MAPPKLSREDLLEAVRLASEYGTKEAARMLGLAQRTVRERVRRGKDFTDELHSMVADGFELKGYSQYTKTTAGEPIWLKTRAAERDYWSGVTDALQSVKDDPPLLVDAPTPSDTSHDLIPWLQIGDAHIGMLASEEETGSNFDIGLAEAEICAAAAALIDLAQPCERMVINDLGDGTHYETFRAMTEASGHSVDFDTRYWKMIRAYIRVTRFIIERALTKASKVDYIVNQGNHSRSNDVWMAETVRALYDHTNRVTVLNNQSPFIAYRMGKTLVMVHHGDKCRPEKLRDVMSSDFEIDWGEAVFRYIDGGHVHHSQRKEMAGCVFESWNNLAPRDKYAHDSGWRSKQCMTMVVRSRSYGEVMRHVMPIERVRDSLGAAHYTPPLMKAFSA